MNLRVRSRRRFPTESFALYLEDEGIRASIAAGAALGVVEILGAWILHAAPLEPIKAAASLLLRERAYQSGYLAFAVPLGIAVHFSLALLYGYAFGLMSTEARLATRLNAVREAAIGFGFGLALWAINFVVIARGLYPWLYATHQLAQALLHGIAFGVPLSVLFARTEQRRVERMGPP
ncbi:MAG TPA: hypothetical protein VGL13_13025 [Polyangiaceae bacterium]|jgi:hypothetical protein